jgi:hypothetical protein
MFMLLAGFSDKPAERKLEKETKARAVQAPLAARELDP